MRTAKAMAAKHAVAMVLSGWRPGIQIFAVALVLVFFMVSKVRCRFPRGLVHRPKTGGIRNSYCGASASAPRVLVRRCTRNASQLASTSEPLYFHAGPNAALT